MSLFSFKVSQAETAPDTSQEDSLLLHPASANVQFSAPSPPLPAPVVGQFPSGWSTPGADGTLAFFSLPSTPSPACVCARVCASMVAWISVAASSAATLGPPLTLPSPLCTQCSCVQAGEPYNRTSVSSDLKIVCVKTAPLVEWNSCMCNGVDGAVSDQAACPMSPPVFSCIDNYQK
uniref:Uncharacterized protein n=1 Tax=Schistocephalus solidus TaxID=70667 RepID=A0A0X3NTM7_SCHSO